MLFATLRIKTSQVNGPSSMETTLAKGLKMLEAVAHSDGPRGVSELGRELGITRSNAHRLLQTLAALGYVRQDQDRKAI